MFDINQFLMSENAPQLDPKGHFLDIADWSEATAEQSARQEGIELTERHWEILYFLREHYTRHGAASSARILLKALEDQFCAGTGKRRLYKLFPGGPVTQGSKIAGLPLPPHHSDPSFGSVT